jgi:DNA-binding MarR family transcriptional regulator
MNALSPARACDPWAVHSAKRLAEEQGRIELSAVQEKIVEVLRQSGGIEPEALAERVGLKPEDLQREIAALRHMEKVRGELRGGRRLVRLW